MTASSTLLPSLRRSRLPWGGGRSRSGRSERLARVVLTIAFVFAPA
ncbi:MAG: hypothetical protein ACLQA5_11080 [Solirubrobacteraceae bacterium]